MCRDVNKVCYIAPGAAPVLLVMQIRFVSKDVSVASNLRQGLRKNTAKSHAPGIP